MEISRIRPNNLPRYTRRILLLGVAFVALAMSYGYRDGAPEPAQTASLVDENIEPTAAKGNTREPASSTALPAAVSQTVTNKEPELATDAAGSAATEAAETDASDGADETIGAAEATEMAEAVVETTAGNEASVEVLTGDAVATTEGAKASVEVLVADALETTEGAEASVEVLVADALETTEGAEASAEVLVVDAVETTAGAKASETSAPTVVQPATAGAPELAEVTETADITKPIAEPAAVPLLEAVDNSPIPGTPPDPAVIALTPIQIDMGQIEFEEAGSKTPAPADQPPTPAVEPKSPPPVATVAAAPDTLTDTTEAEAPSQTPTTAPAPSTQPLAATEPETTAAPEVKAPDEPAPGAEGPPAPVAALAGRFPGKLIMLVFWSSDAENIADTFNWLNNMHDQYSGRGLQILAVNQDSTPRDGEVFAVKNNAHFSVIYDRDRALSRALWVSKLPATYLLNDQGVLLGSHLGFVDEIRGSYEDELRRLLHNEQQK